jgi:hypothetical protein
VAHEAAKRCDSSSRIEVEDKGWSDDGLSWDVSEIKKDFGLEFDAWEKIGEHLGYYIRNTATAG